VTGPLLRTEALSVGYRGRRRRDIVVIDGVSLSLREGELVCLIGPNGAGKSTPLRTVAGMQRPLGGQVWLDGKDVHTLSPRELARTVSVVLTERLPASLLTVYQIVSVGRHPYTDWRGTLTPHDHDVIRKAIESVNAQAFIGRQLNELSDGERQRVMLARALAQEPRLLILDEITAFLDLPRRVEIMHLLRELAHQDGHAVLLTTHDLELALRHADTVWLCAAGGRLTVGPPEELVWNGALEHVFASEGLYFDRERGSFTMRNAHRGVVSVRGTGHYATGTARALERLRFEVVESSADGWPEVDVHVSGTQVSWTLRVGSRTYQIGTLTELLDRVREDLVSAPRLNDLTSTFSPPAVVTATSTDRAQRD
jgi:iron complex transport system ATP-binding protein